MKIKNILCSIVLLLCSFSTFAQVTIGLLDNPNENAILELKETIVGASQKGMLLPRVNLQSLNSPAPLSNFVNGMIVYNLATVDENIQPGFYYSDGNNWVQLKPSEDVALAKEPWFLVNQPDVPSTNVDDEIYHTGSTRVGSAGAIDKTAQMEVYSDAKGLLLPRLSQKQRDAITNPTTSMMIWNIDESCYNFYKKSAWRSLCGGIGVADIMINSANCLAMTTNGVYQEQMPLTSNNYINITVQVIKEGAYSLTATTTNGFSFQKDGVFNEPGVYTVQMYALGTPQISGVSPLTFTNNGEPLDPVCEQSINVLKKEALFYYVCGTDTAEELIRGEDSAGKTLSIDVNIVNPGVFNFYTDTQNGVRYSASNIRLSTPGVQQVTLIAEGTPSVTGTTTFTLSGSNIDPSYIACTATVDVAMGKATLTPNCTSAQANGVYKIKNATTADNYIQMTVNVTNIGSWSAKTDEVNGFSFEGNGVFTATGNQQIKLLANGGTPLKTGTYTFTITVNGSTCTVVVNVVIPTKNVLLIGNTSGAISAALKATANFGVTGTSKVESINVINGPDSPTASQLITYINDNKIDIIISGWSFNRTDDATSVIADFIKNKKGFMFFAQAQDRQTTIKSILDKTYNTSVTLTEDDYSIYTAKIGNVDTPFTNGIFGDIRNKYVRGDDGASWMGMVPSTETDAIFDYLIQLPLNGGYPLRNLFSYATGFFMVPDWGMLNYYNGSYGSYNPIGASTSATNGNSFDGTSVISQNVVAGEVVNWLLFGNTMDYIIKYTDDNTNTAYQVDINYAN